MTRGLSAVLALLLQLALTVTPVAAVAEEGRPDGPTPTTTSATSSCALVARPAPKDDLDDVLLTDSPPAPQVREYVTTCGRGQVADTASAVADVRDRAPPRAPAY